MVSSRRSRSLPFRLRYRLTTFSFSTSTLALQAPPSLHQENLLLDHLEILHQLLPQIHIHPPLEIHLTNVLTALTLTPICEPLSHPRAVRALSAYVQAHRLLRGGFDVDSPRDIYASDVDALGVVEGVLRHRVTWRSEREEVMWLMKGGAGGVDASKTEGRGLWRARRDEVSDVLAEIIRSV